MWNNDQYEYNPDYKKLYPGIESRPDVLEVLIKSDRKMKYMEVEIKQEKFIYDADLEIARFLPSREDSSNRLEENDVQFQADEDSTEEKAFHNLEIQSLRDALKKLDDWEYDLIYSLFFEGLSAREYSKQYKIPLMTVNNRKNRILAKLYKLLKK